VETGSVDVAVVVIGGVVAGVVVLGRAVAVVVVAGEIVAGEIVAGTILGAIVVLAVLILLQADESARELRATPPMTMPASFRNSLRDSPSGLLFFLLSICLLFQNATFTRKIVVAFEPKEENKL
jgi:hypothetical protein